MSVLHLKIGILVMTDFKNCEGCNYYAMYEDRASCIEFNKDDSCPCVVCLVKMVCRHNVCDEWVEWNKINFN